MAKNTTVSGSGMGFGSWLALLFIALKLTGYIDWSWWWVLSPLWVSLALVLFLATAAAVIELRRKY